MSTTENIPTMVTSANEWSAGWRASIREPMPINMMSAERMMLCLYEANIGRW